MNDASTVPAVVALTPPEIETFFADNGSRLRSLLPSAVWFDPASAPAGAWDDLLARVKPAIVVSGWRTPRLPDAPGRLAYVCQVTGSVRHAVPRTLLEAGVIVSNWGHLAAPLVAEHALLLTLALLRDVPNWPTAMRGGAIAIGTGLSVRTLRGKRVSIHGFGRIARELLALLRPFGVSVRAHSAGVPLAFFRDHGVTPVDTLTELAAGADVFVTCEALTDQTRGTIDRSVLERLPTGSVFVNVGRGAIVNETDLAAVAIERQLRVASDVFVAEPLPADSPLQKVPGALYSPHIGGPTPDTYPGCGETAADNIQNFLAGRPVSNRLTLGDYDRAT